MIKANSHRTRIKKKTKKMINSFLILLAIFLVLVLVRVFSKEDTWLCRNGKWEKHGNPYTEMPSWECK